jgi:hypothetical protein
MQNTQASKQVSEDSFLTCGITVNMQQFAILFLAAAASSYLAAPIFNMSRQSEMHVQTLTTAFTSTSTITINNCINCRIVQAG